MSTYQKIKGTQDFFGLKTHKLNYIEKICKDVSELFGYKEIVTPIFEYSEVFIKNVGEESDVVKKEMYTFTDKGNRNITLRPEGTASVARAFIENKLYASSLPCIKLSYLGPMFRYERPQAGRYREFRQFGVEVYGQRSVFLDCDIIASAYAIFNKLGIKNVKILINSIGDEISRKNYAHALREYFSTYISYMCEDCKKRIITNPLRLVDCKIDKNIIINNKNIYNDIPSIHDFLSAESLKYFDEVKNILTNLNIPYLVSPSLVRGLDYYNDLVFEFIVESPIQELNGLALGGGGKYDQMIKSMSNLDIPGTGYALGIDRIISIMDSQLLWNEIEPKTDIIIISLDEESRKTALLLANQLRMENLSVEMEYASYTMKNQFKLCDKINPQFIIIIGENERLSGYYQFKITETKEQLSLKKEELLNYIKQVKEKTNGKN